MKEKKTSKLTKEICLNLNFRKKHRIIYNAIMQEYIYMYIYSRSSQATCQRK